MSDAFKLGGQIFQVVPFLKSGERSVSGLELIERGQVLGITFTTSDCTWVIDHLLEIPIRLGAMPVAAVAGVTDLVLVLYLDANVWQVKWIPVNRKFYGHHRLLRRLQP